MEKTSQASKIKDRRLGSITVPSFPQAGLGTHWFHFVRTDISTSFPSLDHFGSFVFTQKPQQVELRA